MFFTNILYVSVCVVLPEVKTHALRTVKCQETILKQLWVNRKSKYPL
jgi:hypothetical protein